MAEIVFCRPVHHYDSYQDFWRLVELSDFPVIRVDEIDLTKPGVYITAPMNGDYREYFVGDLPRFEATGEISGGEITRQRQSGMRRQAHLILWNLERPSGSAGSIGQYGDAGWELFKHRLVDEIWVSDPALADDTMFRYVTLGSDYDLGEPGEEKDYDFTHMSVVIPRRANIYKHFGNGQIGQNCWGDERHQVLKRSKFALNVHQDNHSFCEPLRIALFAAYGLPVISEGLANSFPYGSDISTHNYSGIVMALKQALNDDYGPWREKGLALRDKLCRDLQFGAVVRQAVKETVGDGWR